LRYQKSQAFFLREAEKMNIRELRFKKGLTQYDVNAKTGIHQSKISLIERGYLFPDESEKKKIADLFSVPVKDIEWMEGG
jgi:transcriptional regulator with XRE-family HTH domain